MKILVFTGYFLPGFRGGGPIRTVKNLIDATGEIFDYYVVTSDRDLGDVRPYKTVDIGKWNNIDTAKALYCEEGLVGFFRILRVVLSEKWSVIYLNSFFSLKFSIFPLILAGFTGAVIVVGPRGEFSKDAFFLNSYVKKKVYIFLFKLFNLKKKVLFQASSPYEAKDIERVIGSEVHVAVAEDVGSRDIVTKDQLSSKGGVVKVVVVARISPVKNLLRSIRLFALVNFDIVFHIYGPIEDQAYWECCKAEIGLLPKWVTVEYKGELHSDDVITTMVSYDLFFMPTMSENYGHSIAEAFRAGLPVLISDQTPWRNLEAAGLGWDVSLNDDAGFLGALNSVQNMSGEQYFQMRVSVLEWANKKFAQRESINQNIEMFRLAARGLH